MYYSLEDEIRRLQMEVEELQAKVVNLRTSRRVLMNLLATQDHMKRIALQQLQLENRRLRARKSRPEHPHNLVAMADKS